MFLDLENIHFVDALVGAGAGALLSMLIFSLVLMIFSQRKNTQILIQENTLKQQQLRIDELNQQLSELQSKYSAAFELESQLKQQLAGLKSESQSLNERLVQQSDLNSIADDKLLNLNSELAELKAKYESREQYYQQQLDLLDKNKSQLKNEFENLANKIFEARSQSFTQQSKNSLDEWFSPFQQQFKDFKDKVEQIHHQDTKARSELKSEIIQLKDLNKLITEEAHSLATALKGQKKMQGNWGELVLENVLDRSGLRANKDYQREMSVTLDSGAKLRPDVVVFLPQNRHLVIDAKVSLNDYTRFVNSEDDIEKNQALNSHVNAMRSRLKELADKDYGRLPTLNSPDVVFMFVPVESAFVEAIKFDETLLQEALEKNILIATPTTLLTSLNIVKQLWRFEEQNKHTAELANKAEGVFKKLNSFLASFQGVKAGLDRAADAYSKAEGQLVSGRGNLVKQVGEFKQLAPSIKAELPEYFVEKADLEIDYAASLKTTDNEIFDSLDKEKISE